MSSHKPSAVFLDKDTFPPYADFPVPNCVGKWSEYPFTSPDEVVSRIQDAHVVIVNKVALCANTLMRAPSLQLIALTATGSNNIDLEYCRDHNIAVANIRNYTTQSLTEHTLALILALKRRIPAYKRRIVEGAWEKHEHFVLFDAPIDDLHGSTLGIVGKGVLGENLARIAEALGMNVLYAEHKGSATCRPDRLPFTEVLQQADIVSLHCPYTAETHQMMGAAEFSRMKKSALIINTARGALIDEQALAQALKEGQIAGAGLDVLSVEPPTAENPLLQSAKEDNVIITPHIAWTSRAALKNAITQTIENIEGFFAGKPLRLLP